MQILRRGLTEFILLLKVIGDDELQRLIAGHPIRTPYIVCERKRASVAILPAVLNQRVRFPHALAAATVTMTPLALQAGSLQNDVWLAAFFLESLWVLRREPAALQSRNRTNL